MPKHAIYTVLNALTLTAWTPIKALLTTTESETSMQQRGRNWKKKAKTLTIHSNYDVQAAIHPEVTSLLVNFV